MPSHVLSERGAWLVVNKGTLLFYVLFIVLMMLCSFAWLVSAYLTCGALCNFVWKVLYKYIYIFLFDFCSTTHIYIGLSPHAGWSSSQRLHPLIWQKLLPETKACVDEAADGKLRFCSHPAVLPSKHTHKHTHANTHSHRGEVDPCQPSHGGRKCWKPLRLSVWSLHIYTLASLSHMNTHLTLTCT